MKINYLKHHEIDKSKWDACINDAVFPMVYAYSWYLDTVTNFKWDALVVGDYDLIFPLPFRCSILGYKQISHPIFAQQLGLFSKKEISETVLSQFLNQIPPRFKKVILKLNEKNEISAHPKYEIQKRINILLDLEFPYEILRKNYSKNLKRSLKKAAQNNLVFSEEISIQTAYNFYFEYRGNQLNFSKKVKKRLYNLFTVLEKKGYAEIVGVYKDQKLLATVFFIHFKNRIIYLIPPSSPEGKQNFAMHFLLDQMVQKYAGQKIILDFEGSNVASIARFYHSFGGKNQIYVQILR